MNQHFNPAECVLHVIHIFHFSTINLNEEPYFFLIKIDKHCFVFVVAAATVADDAAAPAALFLTDFVIIVGNILTWKCHKVANKYILTE